MFKKAQKSVFHLIIFFNPFNLFSLTDVQRHRDGNNSIFFKLDAQKKNQDSELVTLCLFFFVTETIAMVIWEEKEYFFRKLWVSCCLSNIQPMSFPEITPVQEKKWLSYLTLSIMLLLLKLMVHPNCRWC